MTDSIDYNVDFGTPERTKRGNLRMEPRDQTTSGNIITTGLREGITSTLDSLKSSGFLGMEKDSEARHSAGNRLYALFCKFGDTQTTKDIGTPGRGTSGDSLTMEGDIGDSADIAETIYHAVMRHPKLEFRKQIVRVICIDGTLNWPCKVNINPRYLEQVCDGLDVLESVLEEIERKYEK